MPGRQFGDAGGTRARKVALDVPRTIRWWTRLGDCGQITRGLKHEMLGTPRVPRRSAVVARKRPSGLTHDLHTPGRRCAFCRMAWGDGTVGVGVGLGSVPGFGVFFSLFFFGGVLYVWVLGNEEGDNHQCRWPQERSTAGRHGHVIEGAAQNTTGRKGRGRIRPCPKSWLVRPRLDLTPNAGRANFAY